MKIEMVRPNLHRTLARGKKEGERVFRELIENIGRNEMGIITEESKPARVLLDNTEFVRTKRSPERPKELVLGRDSLALREKRVIYRNIQSGLKTVTIIPYKNIDSFCIQTRRLNSLLLAGVVMVLLAVGWGIWMVSALAPTQAFGSQQSSASLFLQLKPLWGPSLTLIGGFIFLVAYTVYHRRELIICTASGNNQVRVSLSRGVEDSVEEFVGALEAQMQTI